MTMRVAATLFLIFWLGTFTKAENGAHFDPDTDGDRISWKDLPYDAPVARLDDKRFGAVVKNYTNEYWRLLADGYRRQASKDGVKLDVQAAQDELSPVRQLSILETMIGGYYQAIMISPQSTSNLQPAIDDARSADLPLVDVDGAVVDDVKHFVGAVNREIGVKVALWFIKNYPHGGKIEVVEGQAGVFSTIKRTAGFIETLEQAGNFSIKSVYGNWDRRLSFEITRDLLKKSRDLIGVYCNNDVMALGAMDAVKALSLEASVRVFGTDGTSEAYASIKAGDLTGTVDIFPTLTGEIGLRVAERLAAGRTVPRVVETPIALITRDEISRFEVGPTALESLLRHQ